MPTHRSLGLRLLTGSGWAAFGRGATAILNFLLVLLVARLLSPSDTGIFFLAFSLVTTSAILARMGLENTAVRLISRHLAHGDLQSAMQAVRMTLQLGALGVLGVASLLTWLVIPWLGAVVFRSELLVALAGWIGVWTAVTALQLLLAEIYRGFHQIREAVLFSGVITSSSSVAGLITMSVTAESCSVETVICWLIFCTTLTTVLAAFGTARRLLSVATDEASQTQSAWAVLTMALPIMVSNVSSSLFISLDLWVVGAYLADSEVAIYGAAARLAMWVRFPLLITNQILPPTISDLDARNERGLLEKTLQGLAALTTVPAALATILVCFLGGTILSFAFGDVYGQGAMILAILSVGQLVQVASGACAFTLMMTGHQTALMRIQLLAIAISIPSAIWAGQTFGAIGIAAAFSATLVGQQAALVVATHRLCGLWTPASFAALHTGWNLLAGRTGDA